jgi:glycosyltransferase involved in cell wall biosynthesis
MEGMYFGLPLILSDVGGTRDLIQNNDIGIIIPNPYKDVAKLDLEELVRLSYDEHPKNTEALAQAMIDFFKNKEKWQKAGKLGREKLLKKYNLEKNIKNYEEIFIEILK